MPWVCVMAAMSLPTNARIYAIRALCSLRKNKDGYFLLSKTGGKPTSGGDSIDDPGGNTDWKQKQSYTTVTT